MTATTRDADALVIFGITGDLARKMTLRSLYRLERRELLNCPVIGVASSDWNVEQPARARREAIKATGEHDRRSRVQALRPAPALRQRRLRRRATPTRRSPALGDATNPVFYLEIPPSLFATVVAGLSEAGLLSGGAGGGGEAVRPRPGVGAGAGADLHQYLDESQLYRIDHFLGKMGLEELLYLRFANAMLEPVWNRNYVSSCRSRWPRPSACEDRGHFYDPVGALRDVVVNHLLQVLAAAAMEPPAGGDPDTLKDAK